mmetsp:Transcript_17916/g.34090  ORF Transcript_17916/g.34090 Transcript_17916/m.34090 type:complete len:201 (+) Transcript_17916:265-867(+)
MNTATALTHTPHAHSTCADPLMVRAKAAVAMTVVIMYIWTPPLATTWGRRMPSAVSKAHIRVSDFCHSNTFVPRGRSPIGRETAKNEHRSPKYTTFCAYRLRLRILSPQYIISSTGTSNDSSDACISANARSFDSCGGVSSSAMLSERITGTDAESSTTAIHSNCWNIRALLRSRLDTNAIPIIWKELKTRWVRAVLLVS